MVTITHPPQPVLVDGEWITEDTADSFRSKDPHTSEPIDRRYPVSAWATCDRALDAAHRAFQASRDLEPTAIAAFLHDYAARIEADRGELVAIAHRETGLPASPRLADVELPRTVNQLRLAAEAARTESWRMPIIDRTANIRSCFIAIGPVAVFGPNNFPFAFNSISGGDFAAAIAAGNPVIAKANTSHPATTERLGQLAVQSLQATGMPRGLVQLIYRTSHEHGERLVADPRMGAVGYTGARSAGLRLKAAADRVGTPFYAELSSVNPVVLLPGALAERCDALVDEYVASSLMGAGQFCTNPGLLLLVKGPTADAFIEGVVSRYVTAPAGTLLSTGVQRALLQSIGILIGAGAACLAGGGILAGPRCAVANTVLRITGGRFLEAPHLFQTEAFGNAALITVCDSVEQIVRIVESLEGNLTGCICSDTRGSDDGVYDRVAAAMQQRVGRLLNDKMPTGVAVSPAMNHGGPYPATSHPGFTAVGIPASMLRFAKLTCYDAVREPRLPRVLRDANPTGETYRCIDGAWTIG